MSPDDKQVGVPFPVWVKVERDAYANRIKSVHLTYPGYDPYHEPTQREAVRLADGTVRLLDVLCKVPVVFSAAGEEVGGE